MADGYAFYTLRNLRRLDEQALDRSPALKAYFERVGARPAVKAALAAEARSPNRGPPYWKSTVVRRKALGDAV
ncbi:glutathione S-transferase family protein [Sorangium sp. So ce1078]|uniref:glutathione S-transferase family protein n=1 Tax=Sorangium sp. So ce1078 TaxID=3133329 RepID=UPI003F6177F4